MRFNLVRPCEHCPFRNDGVHFDFARARAEEIVRSVAEQDLTFPCHETTPAGAHRHRRRRRENREMCGGALIFHEKLGRPNWRIRWAHGLGLFDPARLHLEAPVVDSIEEFVRLQTRESERP